MGWEKISNTMDERYLLILLASEELGKYKLFFYLSRIYFITIWNMENYINKTNDKKNKSGNGMDNHWKCTFWKK